MKRLPEPYTEELLIQRLRTSDREAFTVLYDYYAPALFGIVKRIVTDEETAKDVLQDAFVNVYEAINRYDVEKGRLFTWLLSIARNKALDELRRIRKAVLVELDCVNLTDFEIPNKVYQPNSDLLGIPELVNELPTNKRTLIDLIYFNGYTIAEAAEVLDIPLGTAKTRVRSSLQQLRKLIERPAIQTLQACVA